MTLFLPPALTLNNLNGGYAGHLDFTELGDKQTNDAENVVVTTTTIKQRPGYVRLLDSALTKTGVREITGLDGDRVRGHFQLKKSGNETEIKKHIVAAGANLWDYTSATASIILSGLSDKDDAQWSFVQIQSPTDGTDDVVIGVNGYDPPVLWNGTDASASFLSSVTDSSGVETAKYIVSTKNRIALLNVLDSTDVDSKSKFKLSTFSSAGTPTPHIFSEDLEFYVGGSDKYGEITGGVVIGDVFVITKKNAFWVFNIGGSVTVDDASLSLVHDFSMKQISDNIGCIAPKSLISIGGVAFFLDEKGVYTYDGSSLLNISTAIDNDLKNVNFARRKYAYSAVDIKNNLYYLSIASSGKSYNDTVFCYDLEEKKWMPPFRDMRCDIISNFFYGDEERLLCGDHQGYLYELNRGVNNGKEIGYNVIATSITTGNTLNFNDSQSIDANGDGYLGLSVVALDSTGANADPRLITDSTATQITVTPAWGSAVNSNTTFSIAGINSHFRTKDYDLGSPDLIKFFRSVRTRTEKKGNINLYMNYIVDQNPVSEAATATISQYDDTYLYYTAGEFATGTAARYSGTIETISVGVSSIAVSAGTDLSASNLAGYCVYLWNSGTRRVRPIVSGECETLELGLYGTASLVAVNSDTTYLINTNLENTLGNARSGPAPVGKDIVSLRSIYTQQNAGTHFSLKFYNDRANEMWELYGFDITAKPMGRR